jgi:succinyl-diaminopimelate desuccinylase
MSIEQAERSLRGRVPDAFEFKIVDRAPSGRVCLDAPEVRAFVERSGAALAGKQGWTDVARFTAAGIPAFNFGPGIPEQAHQAGEYCPIANLEPAHRMLGEFLSA